MSTPKPSTNPLLRAWYDKETRSIIIQIIAAIIIMSFFAYVINNAVINMAKLGKDINFTFLSDPSSYDINQTLIDYSSRSSHFRAGLVGLINTLLVAVFGIIIATILGFTLGVMRLSKNFITQKLAYVYIEYMRNVPVLLHILLLYGIIVNVFPKTKQAYNFDDTFFLSNRGLMSPTGTFESAMWPVFFVLLAGIAFTFWFRSFAKKSQEKNRQNLPSGFNFISRYCFATMLGLFSCWQPYYMGIPGTKRIQL